MSNLLIATTNLLAQNISWQAPTLDIDYMQEDAGFEHLRIYLAAHISELMSRNMERLFYILYRLDISESKALCALNGETSAPPAYALADLIIAREIEKVKTRQWYKKEQSRHMAVHDINDDIERW